MVEVERSNSVDINCQNESGHEAEKLITMEDVIKDYESRFDSAIQGSDEDAETDFDIRCAREALVSEGLAVIKTVADCDQISLRLNSVKDKDLLQKVWIKRDSLEFMAILKEFDTLHEAILNRDTSSDEDSEALEKDRCDQLRCRYLSKAVRLINTQKECQEILGRTLERHTYIRQLVNEKMALLPLEGRKSV